MLVDARRFMQTAPHIVVFSGGAIVISAIGFNLLGDGLRETLDPKLKR
jgi:peptide/nickel transport system permease protein